MTRLVALALLLAGCSCPPERFVTVCFRFQDHKQHCEQVDITRQTAIYPYDFETCRTSEWEIVVRP